MAFHRISFFQITMLMLFSFSKCHRWSDRLPSLDTLFYQPCWWRGKPRFPVLDCLGSGFSSVLNFQDARYKYLLSEKADLLSEETELASKLWSLVSRMRSRGRWRRSWILFASFRRDRTRNSIFNRILEVWARHVSIWTFLTGWGIVNH